MNGKAFMERAVELARHHAANGDGGPFGAVIVKDGVFIAEGWNCVTSTNDPTAHAEVVAIRNACSTLQTYDLSGCEIFASCEPCPMCLAAIYWAHLDRVYFSLLRADAQRIGFADAHIYQELAQPLEARQLPMIHLPTASATAVFEEWLKNPNRKQY